MKLSVVIASYNRFDLLRRAIESLRQSEIPFEHETIVVDNASGGAGAVFADPFYCGVRVLRQAENLGFGRANNIGAAAAHGGYLLFLNSDARVEPDAVALMVGKMDADSEIGALGPLTLNGDGTFQLSYGRKISLFSEWDQKKWAPGREARRMGSPPRRDILRPVGWVSGSCLLTRKEYFPGGRVFDPRFFLYFEDHDLCLRIRRMGKQVMFWSKPAVFHLGGRSVSRSARVQVEYRRSQLLLYEAHASPLQLFLLRRYLRRKFSAGLRRASDNPDARGEGDVCREVLGMLETDPYPKER